MTRMLVIVLSHRSDTAARENEMDRRTSPASTAERLALRGMKCLTASALITVVAIPALLLVVVLR